MPPHSASAASGADCAAAGAGGGPAGASRAHGARVPMTVRASAAVSRQRTVQPARHPCNAPTGGGGRGELADAVTHSSFVTPSSSLQRAPWVVTKTVCARSVETMLARTARLPAGHPVSCIWALRRARLLATEDRHLCASPRPRGLACGQWRCVFNSGARTRGTNRFAVRSKRRRTLCAQLRPLARAPLWLGAI